MVSAKRMHMTLEPISDGIFTAQENTANDPAGRLVPLVFRWSDYDRLCLPASTEHTFNG